MVQLAAQGLLRPPAKRARKADVLAAIRRMGALQIDTINVVARSPYLVLWSRLGAYDATWLDELLAERKIFEYWAHEACFLPIEDFSLFRHRMLEPESMGWKYRSGVEHTKLAPQIIAAIRERGPARSSDFQRRDGLKGGWWQWKGEKRVLENLFTAGELMIARRHNFQRVYELRERVLPRWDDSELPPRVETERRLALNAVRALGITQPSWVADYYRMSKKTTPAIVDALVAGGKLMCCDVDGWKQKAVYHPDQAELIERASSGQLKPTYTTLLSPFDPIVWDRARAKVQFDFEYRLECYTPGPKRQYGYYVLPILRRGALVGRLDAKAHRDRGVFEVKSLHLEAGVPVSAALAADVARALAKCAAWHGTPEVLVRKSVPAAFARQLKAAL